MGAGPQTLRDGLPQGNKCLESRGYRVPLRRHLALGLAFSHPQDSGQTDDSKGSWGADGGQEGRGHAAEATHVYAARNDPSGPLAGDVLGPTAALTKAGARNQKVGHFLLWLVWVQ